jgi:P27 family predicted phage terminase small subunit
MGGTGSGGGNRKPTAVKKLQGNAGKRRLNEREPAPEVAAPEMPEYLTGEAALEWQRLVPILLSMKVLTPSDQNALAALCCAHAQFVEAQRDIALNGQLLDIYAVCEYQGVPITGKSGAPKAVLLEVKKNPSIQIASDADRRLRAYYAMFGLNPASRSKLSTNASSNETPDALDSLFDAPAQSAARKPN